MVCKDNGRLVCLTPYDAELLDGFPNGQEFELTPRRGRSNRQYRLYRKILSEVAKASDRWPTGDHLHDELKIKLGYWHFSYDTKHGRLVKAPDSTAFDQMNAAEFNKYFQKAKLALTEYLGADPVEFLSNNVDERGVGK